MYAIYRDLLSFHDNCNRWFVKEGLLKSCPYINTHEKTCLIVIIYYNVRLYSNILPPHSVFLHFNCISRTGLNIFAYSWLLHQHLIIIRHINFYQVQVKPNCLCAHLNSLQRFPLTDKLSYCLSYLLEVILWPIFQYYFQNGLAIPNNR